ncbi:DUF2806 domain-containing protein [Rhizobium leguminosarum bv. viciae]|nr:DUF2806 domain-containing protein [Rhizobium leguminosarum bv. viciae]TCB49067.1 DUF2806 domain-containing protein [Rhizobium leguminosarum bv. viciae]
MTDDHLSNETSLSAQLTETGVTASAKSRTVAAIDRLMGNLADLPNAFIESVIVRKRAKTEGERHLIEAAAQYGVLRMGQDHEFAERAYENHFRKIASQQLNKDAVVAEALDNLRLEPPDPHQSSSGPEVLGDEFMDRFERYAESATTDDLRHRWGRILAGEIRRPGTFGPKVLRATDELDSEAAALFEKVCKFQFRANAISKDLAGELSFDVKMKLVEAGLVVDPGLTGHLSLFNAGRLNGAEPAWFFTVGSWAIGFKQSCAFEVGDGLILKNREGTPAMDAYILTDVGTALSSILPADDEMIIKQLGPKIQASIKDGILLYFRTASEGRMIGAEPPV